MHQVAADEFGVFKGDGPPGIAELKAAGRKGHLLIIHGKDIAVGDGELMCISAEVFNGIAKTVESLLCCNEKGIARQSQNKGGGPYGQ